MTAALYFPPLDPFAGPSRTETAAIADSDIRTLNALAAYQLLYGKPREALAFLQLTLRLAPDDPQTLRLLAEAFLASGDAATAERMMTAHEAAVGRARLAPRDLLRRARILAGLRKLAAAASAFTDYAQARSR